MNYNMKQSGERIQQLPIQAGYTQSKPALKLKINRSFLSHIEAGKKGCSVDLLVQLSKLLNVSLDFLILGKDTTSIKEELEELITRLMLLKKNLDLMCD